MIINKDDFEPNSFYDDFIQYKQPVLVKNFLPTNELNQLFIDRRRNLKPSYGREAVPFLYLYFDDPLIRQYVFDLPIINALVHSKKIRFRRQMRLWEHGKGHVSRFHYDQYSIDLFNICLAGSKRWLFISPETPLKCWPFYNVALPFQKQYESNAIAMKMEKGDLIYIPRNWFHQVTTLQNDTKNINVIFSDLADTKLQQREKELASIKRLLRPKYIYGDNVEVFNDEIKKVTLATTVRRVFIEITPIFLLATVVLVII